MDSSRYQVAPDIWLDARRAVWLPSPQVLAVADLHLGYAWVQRCRGQLIPVSEPDEIVERLLDLQSFYRPREIVLLGDIVHQALRLPQVIDELKDLCTRLSLQSSLVLIAGNHDRQLDRLLAECELACSLKTCHWVGSHLLTHGDLEMIPSVKSDFEQAKEIGGHLIMGHEHPAIGLGDGVTRTARCHCFLVGQNIVILPAFSCWAAGTLVGRDGFMSRLARDADFTQAVAILGEKLLPVSLRK